MPSATLSEYQSHGDAEYFHEAGDAGAGEFLRERLEGEQSVIFVALRPDGPAVGFTQLYPSFSSASARRSYILNDLFVDPGTRSSGVGQQLLEAAAEFGRGAGAVSLTLSTAHTNTTAQAPYEAQGWRARRSLPQLPFTAVVTARRQLILPR